MQEGLTIANTHPGALRTGELTDLQNLASVLGAKSPQLAGLISEFVERELSRRDDETEIPAEPALCQVGAHRWSNAALGNALIAAIAGFTASEDSSPRVRAFLSRLLLTIGASVQSRLERENNNA